jgi:hypothetical protein
MLLCPVLGAVTGICQTCGGTRFLRAATYEVEVSGRAAELERHLTTTPVTLIDPLVGVAEAWALVEAADTASDGKTGHWVSLPLA